MIVLIDVLIIVLLWLPMLRLREQLTMPEALGGLPGHVAWAVFLACVWLLLGRLDPLLRQRRLGDLGGTLARLLGPVLLLGLSTQVTLAMDLRYYVPVLLMIPWSAAALIALTIVRWPRSSGPATPVEPRSAEARLAFGAAGLGLALLTSVRLFPDPKTIYTTEIGEHLVAIVRGVLQLTGLAGIAILLGIQLAKPLAKLRQRVLKLNRKTFLTLAALASVALSGAFAYVVLDHMPHIQDEIAVLFQAKSFAAGRLYAKVPPAIEAFDQEYIVIDGDKWYGKYFPGPSLLLTPGVLLDASWAIHPLISIPAILLLFALARRLVGERLARTAVILAVISPFWVMTFASHMAHPGCLLLLTAMAVCIVAGISPTGRWYHAVGAGLAWAAAVWFRPYTAVLLAIPWLGYALIRVFQRRSSPAMIPWFAASAIVVLLPLLAYNKALTGDAFLAPFTKYAPTDRLGFGDDLGMDYWPDDRRTHTFTRGLGLLCFQLDELGEELLGWPRGILLLLLIGGLLAARKTQGRLLLAVGAALPVGHIFYHFGQSCFGPRYYSEALPVYLILMALGLALTSRWLYRVMKSRGLARPRRCAVASTLALAGLGLAGCLLGFVPQVIGYYGYDFGSVDPAVRNTVAKARPGRAIVFVGSMHYRSHKLGQWSPDYYAAAFYMNSPSLDDEVIFARDLDSALDERFTLGKTAEVAARFPDRTPYRFVCDGLNIGHLEPLTTSTMPKKKARTDSP
ncbi:MAG: glycosyltransferase family 39 protein [Phycisphaerae bacterium]|nr:glycosyltransferase family 39 protein [Phycisphaerae bacterium]